MLALLDLGISTLLNLWKIDWFNNQVWDTGVKMAFGAVCMVVVLLLVREVLRNKLKCGVIALCVSFIAFLIQQG